MSSSNDTATATALAASAAVANNQDHSRDPIELGRQILDAYLTAKRRQELEDEEKERLREEAEAAEHNKTDTESNDGGDPPTEPGSRMGRSSESKTAAKRQPLVKTPSSTRKSFRDFKHISRRIFMRHSSSKHIQIQQQSPSVSGGSGNPSQAKRNDSGDSGGSRLASIDKKHSADFQGKQQSQESPTAKGRRLLRIKRSETVFEATTVPPGGGGHGTSKLLHQLSTNFKKS